MNPRRILVELDLLGAVVWWQDLGNEPRPPKPRFEVGLVPPLLTEEIERDTVEPHKIVPRKPRRTRPASTARGDRAILTSMVIGTALGVVLGVLLSSLALGVGGRLVLGSVVGLALYFLRSGSA